MFMVRAYIDSINILLRGLNLDQLLSDDT